MSKKVRSSKPKSPTSAAMAAYALSPADIALRDRNIREREQRREAASRRARAAKRKVTIELPAGDFGMFAGAAVVHGVSVERMISIYLQDTVCDWCNNDYILENFTP